MNNEIVRAFWAFELPSELKKLISEKINILKKEENIKVKWVEEENLHITLRFLGNVPLKKLLNSADLLYENFKNETAIQFSINQKGFFPNLKNPNVIWLGVADENDKLKKYSEKANNLFLKLGYPKEDKPFKSHITIGRIKYFNKNSDFINKFNSIDFGQNSYTINNIILFKSELKSDGPIYTPLKNINLI